jgi:uncharacterized protein (DUF486 family)
MPPAVQFVLLLICSNVFMTVAWYGHLKQKGMPLWQAVLISWGVAFLEYCFQVPANRAGHRVFTLTQLKVTQECVTLVVFLVYAYVAFREPPRWNTVMAMGLIVGAVWLTFLGRG